MPRKKELKKHTSRAPKETEKIAGELARGLAETEKGGTLVIALSGDLGAAKTAFAKGFLRALGVKERIASPTFVIMREYSLKIPGYRKAYHADVYRLERAEDAKVFRLDKIVKEKGAIVIVEWAEKVKKILPRKTIWLKLYHGAKPHERVIEISK